VEYFFLKIKKKKDANVHLKKSQIQIIPTKSIENQI